MKYLILLTLLVMVSACQRNTDPLKKYDKKFSQDINKADKKLVQKTIFKPEYTRYLNFFKDQKEEQVIEVNMYMSNLRYSIKLIDSPKGMKLIKSKNGLKISWNPTLKNLEIKKEDLEDKIELMAYIKIVADEDETKENKLLIKKLEKLPIEINVYVLSRLENKGVK